MPKAHRKSRAKEDDGVSPWHGTTNEEEAKDYSKSLDSIVIQMGVDVKEELGRCNENHWLQY